MAVTKIYSTLVFVVAAITAIVLGFSPKFGALIMTIPGPVLGGLAIVVFGLITATGARIWVQNQVDFSRARNLVTVAVTLTIGAGDLALNIRRLHARRHRHRDVRRHPPLPTAGRRPPGIDDMTLARYALLFLIAPILLLAGCATRPVNPPVTSLDPTAATGCCRAWQQNLATPKDSLVILTFSGGGTRAAAFAYGVLEVLRKTEVDSAEGPRSAARRGRRDHRRVGRQLHGARVRAVRRQAVRRVRNALPQAQRAGRTARRAS